MQRTRVLIGAVAVIVAAVAVAGYLIATEPLRSDLAVQDRAAADLLKRMGYHEPGQFALAIWKTSDPEKYAAAMELPEVRARQEDLRAQLAHLGWLAVAIAGGSLFAGAVVAALLPTGRKRA